MSIAKALSRIRPGAKYTVMDDYQSLVWHDKNQKKPTREEINVEIQKIKKEWEDTEYQRLRAIEYPPVTDYLDAVVKGDQEKIQAYIDACLAVKAKYPKPEGV